MSIPERRERERAQRHQLIITAARELAEAEGWAAVTTRRLAERVEYSQPVLYSHFPSKTAIVAAVALEGFAELAAHLRTARTNTSTPNDALRALAEAYLDFAHAKPALYDAMFVLPTDLGFARPDTRAPLRAAFDELRATITPLAGDRDPETLTEIAWSALHGLATLTRAGRLRPDYQQQRIELLTDHLVDSIAPSPAR